MNKLCENCQKPLVGRSDKRFCSVGCKNAHHIEKKKSARDTVREIDHWLHRNREILLTLMGASKKEMVDKSVLTRAGFKFDQMTGIYFNKEHKMYRIVYDFAWMDFSNQQVLLVRK